MADIIAITIFSWIVSVSVIRISECYSPVISNYQWLYHIVFFRSSMRRPNAIVKTTSTHSLKLSNLMIYIVSSGSTVSFGLATQTPGQFFIFSLLSTSLLVLMVVDWNFYLLPDVLVFFIMWLGLLSPLSLIAIPYEERIIGACAGYMSLYLLEQFYFLTTGKHGIGHGDMKLLGALGAWCGWDRLPHITLIACVAALFYFYILQPKNFTHSSKPIIPFGSFLAISSLIIVPYSL